MTSDISEDSLTRHLGEEEDDNLLGDAGEFVSDPDDDDVAEDDGDSIGARGLVGRYFEVRLGITNYDITLIPLSVNQYYHHTGTTLRP